LMPEVKRLVTKDEFNKLPTRGMQSTPQNQHL
jgi:hypothetical protein